MTRNLMAVAAAMALLGGGYGPRSVAREWDDETEERVRRAHEARAKESEAQRKRIGERRQARTAEEERIRLDAAKAAEMLGNGIEPTTGHPLSRQRRRALLREGYKFASVDTRPKGGDAQQAPFMGSAVGAAETPQPVQSPPLSQGDE